MGCIWRRRFGGRLRGRWGDGAVLAWIAALAVMLAAGSAVGQSKEEYVRELFEKRSEGWSANHYSYNDGQHKAVEQDCVVTIESTVPPSRIRVRIDFKRMAAQSLSRDVLNGSMLASGSVSMLGPDDAVAISGATSQTQITKRYIVFGSHLPQYPKIFEHFITDICPDTNRRF